MKKRFQFLFISCVLFVVMYGSFRRINVLCAAPTPDVSHTGGYYSESFYLELTAPSNGTIHYTTDGSTPCVDSPVYTQPILIQDCSSNPNVYNAAQNVVLDWKKYTPDSAPVIKGTVIRALFINELGISSNILNQTYFVGIPEPAEGYTLSLIFEPSLLFGEDGIYVTGVEYDNWYLSENKTDPQPLANFQKNQEVMVTAQLIKDSSKVMDQQIGIRLQGNTARNEVLKRFSLFSREEYSGSNYFAYPIYGDTTTHSVMLKYYLPDAIAADLLSDRAVSVQKSVPVRVFLNGEFLYDTYMLERYDSSYFNKYYQIEHYQIIKNGLLDSDSTNNPEIPDYGEYLFWVAHTDFSDDDQWQQFLHETDIQSYIDWMIANYFLCNIDFRDDHNHVLWRSSFSSNKQWEDSRWRWCIYDIDALAWVGNDPSRGDPSSINIFSNHMNKDMHNTTLFTALRCNPDFCRRFVLSFMDMYNNNFSTARVTATLEKYGNSQDFFHRYFHERPTYATTHLAEEFGLTGSLETLTVRTAQSKMGTVTVNTSTIDLSDGEWSGKYFTDYPITVSATANDGYQFLGWKGDADTQEASITVNVDGGVSLEAVFAKTK